MNKNKETKDKYEENAKVERKTSPRGKGRGNRRNSSKDKSVPGRTSKSMNDIAWYALNEQLLRDSASIPYAWATGLVARRANGYKEQDFIVPGMLSIALRLSPISLNNAADPVNVAARAIVGAVRAKNSGGKAYDPNDMMIRILAEGEFVAMLNWAIRLYGTVNMYSAYNKYMPRDLMKAQHCDPDEFREHLATYRYELNNVIMKAAHVLYVPQGLSIFKRWAWLYSNYYCDSSNPKDQLYFYKPAGYRYFTIDEETSAGVLKYVDINDAVELTTEDVIAMLNQMLDPLIDDIDMALMTADMEKFYGPTMMKFAVIPDILVSQPYNDPVTLQQFKDARDSLGNYLGGDNNDIVQSSDGTYLSKRGDVYVPKQITVTYTEGGSATALEVEANLGSSFCELYASDLLMDTPNPSPTAVDNMENSRLANMVMFYVPGTNDIKVVGTCGSEEVVNFSIGYRVYYRDNNSYQFITSDFHAGMFDLHFTNAACELINQPFGYNDYHVDDLWSSYVLSHTFGRKLRALLSMFDFAPTIYWGELAVDASTDQLTIMLVSDFDTPTCRLSNFAMIDSVMMQKMNNCALLSELHIGGFQPTK